MEPIYDGRAAISLAAALYLAVLLILGYSWMMVLLGLLGVAAYLLKPRESRGVGAVLLALSSITHSPANASSACIQAILAVILFALVVIMLIPLGLVGGIHSDLAVVIMASALLALVASADMLLPPSTWMYEARDVATRILITPPIAAASCYALMRLKAEHEASGRRAEEK